MQGTTNDSPAMHGFGRCMGGYDINLAHFIKKHLAHLLKAHLVCELGSMALLLECLRLSPPPFSPSPPASLPSLSAGSTAAPHPGWMPRRWLAKSGACPSSTQWQTRPRRLF